MIGNEDRVGAAQENSTISARSPDEGLKVPVEKATFGRRWAAYVIDGIMVSLLGAGISWLGGLEGTPAWWAIAWALWSTCVR